MTSLLPKLSSRLVVRMPADRTPLLVNQMIIHPRPSMCATAYSSALSTLMTVRDEIRHSSRRPIAESRRSKGTDDTRSRRRGERNGTSWNSKVPSRRRVYSEPSQFTPPMAPRPQRTLEASGTPDPARDIVGYQERTIDPSRVPAIAPPVFPSVSTT